MTILKKVCVNRKNANKTSPASAQDFVIFSYNVFDYLHFTVFMVKYKKYSERGFYNGKQT